MELCIYFIMVQPTSVVKGARSLSHNRKFYCVKHYFFSVYILCNMHSRKPNIIVVSYHFPSISALPPLFLRLGYI